jgi:hypothetical protein
MKVFRLKFGGVQALRSMDGPGSHHVAEIRSATGRKRTLRNTSMAQLFGDAKCTAEILAFLATTGLGLRGRLREDDPGGGEPGGSD